MFLLLALNYVIAIVKIVKLVVGVMVVVAVVATVDAVDPKISFKKQASCSFFIFPNSRGIQPFRMRPASF